MGSIGDWHVYRRRLWLVVAMSLHFPLLATTQSLDSLVSPGELNRVHHEQRGLRNCTTCHSPGQGIGDDKCLACHEDLNARVVEGRGFHRDKSSECASCHAEHRGADVDLIRWDSRAFNHDETGYALIGKHLEVNECRLCHRAELTPARALTDSFLLTDSACTACHTDPHAGEFGADCESCHSLASTFAEVDFDHSRTAFPLRAAHTRVPCESCHRSGQWTGLAFQTCGGCHADPHRPSLGADCLRCHSESSFTTADIDHSRTAFPLLGKHQGVDCVGCHLDNQFRGIAYAQCRDCHSDDPHWGQFPDDCERCHAVEGFELVSYDHSLSRYPLTGRHESLECELCHIEEVGGMFPAGEATAVRYTPIDTGSCQSCHEDAHFGQLTAGCESCHVTLGFELEHSAFDHALDASFRLMGKHERVQCEQCHRPESASFPAGPALAVRYKPIANECMNCHDNVHSRAWWLEQGLSEPTDCERCHSVHEGFTNSAFDHNRTTFPLSGAHERLSCELCHDHAVMDEQQFLLFDNRGRDCIACHESPHLTGMEDCTRCHNTVEWIVGG